MPAPIPRIHAARLDPPAMLVLLAGCGDDAVPNDQINPVRAPEIAHIGPAEDALAGSNFPVLDPATMNDTEIRKATGTGSLRVFHRDGMLHRETGMVFEIGQSLEVGYRSSSNRTAEPATEAMQR